MRFNVSSIPQSGYKSTFISSNLFRELPKLLLLHAAEEFHAAYFRWDLLIAKYFSAVLKSYLQLNILM